jgi:hypothetical protein
MARMLQIALRACLVSLLMAGGGRLAAAAESAYTRHDWQACPSVDDPEGVAEHRRCAGHMNIRVNWIGAPDGSYLSIGRRPLDESLNLGSFFEVGNTIEWRMAAQGQRPFAAIVRYDVGQRIGLLDGSRLVVYRLGRNGASCIVGSVNGRTTDANQRARALADRYAPRFVCGVSAQRGVSPDRGQP